MRRSLTMADSIMSGKMHRVGPGWRIASRDVRARRRTRNAGAFRHFGSTSISMEKPTLTTGATGSLFDYPYTCRAQAFLTFRYCTETARSQLSCTNPTAKLPTEHPDNPAFLRVSAIFHYMSPYAVMLSHILQEQHSAPGAHCSLCVQTPAVPSALRIDGHDAARGALIRSAPYPVRGQDLPMQAGCQVGGRVASLAG